MRRNRPISSTVLALAVASFGASVITSPAWAAPSSKSAGAAKSAARPAAATLTPVRNVEGIEELRLSNGLQVLLVPDASKPTTTVNLTYHVGSRHENYGETGMAHLLEHLIFKGSTRHPKAWEELNNRGFRYNGSTWLDRTNYFASFSARDDDLRWMLDWLADSMTRSFIAKKDLDSEMTVVRNEMERGENDPQSISFQRLQAAMFDWHNYRNDTIGARADVENVDIGRLQAFYRTYYQPDNATLIVSGRFDAAQVRAWIGQYFGAIPKPQRVLPRLYTVDPAQDGEREFTLRRSGGAPQMLIGYRGVPTASPEQAAAELATLILGDTPSGRLHRQLVEKGLAAQAFGFVPNTRDPGFLVFGLTLSPAQSDQAAREALQRTIESVAQEPITQAELDRARAKWLKAWDDGFADPEKIGVAMSESIGSGDWRLYFLLRDRVREASLADVQRFMQNRLQPSNRTLVRYVPTDKPERAAPQPLPDIAAQLQSFKPQTAGATAEAFEATTANLQARTRRGAEPGLTWALLPKSTRGDVVRAVLELGVGSPSSLQGQDTAGHLMAAMLGTGAKGMTREQIRDRLDALRSDIAFGLAGGRLIATIQSRKETFAPTLELLRTLLREPVFEERIVEEARHQMLAGLAEAAGEPGALAQREIGRRDNPYPAGDPRHVNTLAEDEAAARAVTAAQVREFHQRFLGGGAAQFAAVGPIDEPAVLAQLRALLDGWRAPQAWQRLPTPAWQVEPGTSEIRTPDKQNAVMRVRMALPIDDSSADWPALMMANYLLGESGSSRLWTRIREQDGLSYGVGTGVAINPYEPMSWWGGSAIFAPENRARVDAGFREEIARARDKGFTAEELANGKRGLLGERSLVLAQDGAVATLLTRQGELGRTFAEREKLDAAIAALTLDQVNAALRKYVQPERIYQVFAGDFARDIIPANSVVVPDESRAPKKK